MVGKIFVFLQSVLLIIYDDYETFSLFYGAGSVGVGCGTGFSQSRSNTYATACGEGQVDDGEGGFDPERG